jgi:dTDP-4-amino-4,6-dideoxygalactose transaminase
MEPVPLLDLRAQHASIRDDVERAIRRVVEGQTFVLGPEVEAFETELAGYAGAAHAIGCASGTDALILALAACGVGSGDEIVTTPFTFFSTASCAYKVGARPRFADIDPDTFAVDPERVEAACGPRTRAIVPVHLFGQCAPLEALGDVARRERVPLVEDAAQALGATYLPADGAPRKAGTVGAIGCYSFFPTKNLGAYGDGGAAVTDDPELAERLRVLRVHGGRQMYHHRWVGWNSRLDALQAAVLRVKLPHLDGWCRARAALAARYDALFHEAGLVASGHVRLPARDARSTHIFHQYTLRAERRDDLRQHLQASGIGHGVYYPVPLHLQECFADLGYRPGDFPHAEAACREVVSLPIYPELGAAQQERVVDAVCGFYRAPVKA